MKEYQLEIQNRIEWIREILKNSNSDGIVYGNSGGKDSALVGILCKMTTKNTTGVIMPCSSSQNYGSDKEHAHLISKQFNIDTIEVDLTETRNTLLKNINKTADLNEKAINNINPRLRMTTLYAIAQTKNCLVAGTGNKSELYMGYFTKYGDGGVDFNPISDLTATEIFEFLKFLKAPKEIIEKSPSAGLYEGQTDEDEMGISYKSIDEYIKTKTGSKEEVEIIKKAYEATSHKRNLPLFYK